MSKSFTIFLCFNRFKIDTSYCKDYFKYQSSFMFISNICLIATLSLVFVSNPSKTLPNDLEYKINPSPKQYFKLYQYCPISLIQSTCIYFKKLELKKYNYKHKLIIFEFNLDFYLYLNLIIIST